jgi:hypothetical protein
MFLLGGGKNSLPEICEKIEAKILYFLPLFDFVEGIKKNNF